VTGDRGLAGGFNSQIIRAGNRRARELEADGKTVLWYASGRRGASSLSFRGLETAGEWQGFTDRPSYGDARDIAGGIATDYIDGKVDRVEMIYNGYVSAMTQNVTTDVLLPLSAVEQLLEGDDEGAEEEQTEEGGPRTLWLYEPEPEEILARLHRDLDLPRAARVHGLRARRPHDRDAQRPGERGRDHRRPHPGDEPPAPGRDHPGDHGSGRRRGGPVMRTWIREGAR
jgi:hypothetical protein